MNRAERRRQQREMARGFGPGFCAPSDSDAFDPDEPGFVTDPGCDSPEHRQSIFEAMLRLHSEGPWSGVSTMKCGCTIEVRRVGELFGL